MISKTKKELNPQEIKTLCASAGFVSIENIHALGAGEFNAVYAFDADGKGYALKIAPSVDTPVMTYEKNMMRSELFWYEQLRAHTNLAHPEVVYSDLSRTLLPSDFFIMQRVAGKQMNETQFSQAEKETAAALMPQIAAKLHRVSNNGFGYPQNGLHETWAKALYAMTEAMVEDAASMGQLCENGEKTLAFIRKHQAVLERVPSRMVNFDLWEANIICEPAANGYRFVIIDPERGFWGDPIMDFNCFGFGKPLREKKDGLHIYNSLAEQPVTIGRGEEIRNAFAQAYLGVIMEVERYYRYVPGDEGWTRNDQVCEFIFKNAFACLDEM
ncbi:MAG TPA: aminoglycoside phosphotransferase family protein [Candidatus Limiplasma sp.]|nr:aminoglycoside phosphotransferase family protein [Candidatus Limiplasma sp.]HRX09068.1 aminoglycoside phosphotransferase family protein [Candidatus Limiplasma sp.]